MALPTKVIVITGATSGIGLSFLERLLLETRFQFILRICILCRNMKKGEFVRSTLLLTHKSADIELVKMDTEDIKSVLEAAKVIKQGYDFIDYLYLNAGILPSAGMKISALLSSNVMEILKTGEHILLQDNPRNKLGMQSVFATNALGHFILFQELQPILTPTDKNTSKCSNVVWTTSCNAVKNSFHMDDFTCVRGTMPYGSSKYIVNGLSMAINHHFNDDGVYSTLAEPGLCVTGLNGGFIPGWLWKIGMVIFMLLRIVMNHFTITPFNGSESLVWIFKQNPNEMKSDHQYESATTIFNRSYVRSAKLEVTETESAEIYEKMCNIAANIRILSKLDFLNSSLHEI